MTMTMTRTGRTTATTPKQQATRMHACQDTLRAFLEHFSLLVPVQSGGHSRIGIIGTDLGTPSTTGRSHLPQSSSCFIQSALTRSWCVHFHTYGALLTVSVSFTFFPIGSIFLNVSVRGTEYQHGPQFTLHTMEKHLFRYSPQSSSST